MGGSWSVEPAVFVAIRLADRPFPGPVDRLGVKAHIDQHMGVELVELVQRPALLQPALRCHTRRSGANGSMGTRLSDTDCSHTSIVAISISPYESIQFTIMDALNRFKIYQ